MLPSIGRAQDPSQPVAVDTEHIFGFTEGADIGGKGEAELENTTTVLFGRPGRSSEFNNETAFRYGVEEHFRASIGVFTDYCSSLTFGGLSSEFRWQASSSENAPLGLTLSFAPQWQRIDGQRVQSYSLPIALLADTAFVPNTTFAAFNLTYSPAFTRMSSTSQLEQPLEISQAFATAIADRIFAGAEIRHVTRNQDGFFSGHALFVGPSVFAKLSDNVSLKPAWSAQIPDETTGVSI